MASGIRHRPNTDEGTIPAQGKIMYVKQRGSQVTKLIYE